MSRTCSSNYLDWNFSNFYSGRGYLLKVEEPASATFRPEKNFCHYIWHYSFFRSPENSFPRYFESIYYHAMYISIRHFSPKLVLWNESIYCTPIDRALKMRFKEGSADFYDQPFLGYEGFCKISCAVFWTK